MPDLSIGGSPAPASALTCFVFLLRSRHHLTIYRVPLCTCLLSTCTSAPRGGDFVRYPARCLLQGLACCRHSADACQQTDNSGVGLSPGVCCRYPPRVEQVEQVASPDLTNSPWGRPSHPPQKFLGRSSSCVA